MNYRERARGMGEEKVSAYEGFVLPFMPGHFCWEENGYMTYE